ncbi:putative transporter [Drosera capensis]
MATPAPKILSWPTTPAISTNITDPHHSFISFSLYTSRNFPSSSCSCRCSPNPNHNNNNPAGAQRSKHDAHEWAERTEEPAGLEEGAEGRRWRMKRSGWKRLLFGNRSLWRRIFVASRKVRSVILLNVVTVVYASDIPIIKEVEAIMDPATFSVIRFAVTAIPFIPFIVRARSNARIRDAGMELGLWVSLGYLMQALGLLSSGAGRAAFLSMLTVIVVPLLDGIFGAKVPTITWFGALMSVVGVAMLESSGSPPCFGDLLNFLSAVFFGIHMLRTERIARETSKENFLPLLGYEISVLSCSSLMWYCGCCLFGKTQLMDPHYWTWQMFWKSLVSFPWIPALYTGAFSTGLCLWIEMAAMTDVSATETAVIYALEPVWGAGFAWFLLGERWGTVGWLGAALVLGGSLMVQMLGSSMPDEKAGREKERVKKDERQLALDKKSGFSASPVVSTSRKSPDMLEK